MIGSFIEMLNGAGSHFWRYALAMLIQSSILIGLLLLVDFLLRKRVRAIVRYWLWMLVLVKLVLPPTLCLPTGIGRWVGDYLNTESPAMNAVSLPPADIVGEATTSGTPAEAMEFAQPFIAHVPDSATDTAGVLTAKQASLPSLSWQACVFLAWVIGVLLLVTFMIKRVLIIRGYLARSQLANGRLIETLNECRTRIGIRRPVELRITKQELSPAACGLVRPKILLSSSALGRLSRDKVRTILTHELAHIKRGDLWVNFAQSLLQVVYFYNPLVWFANAVLRRVREQAVDEMVLVCMGGEPKDYSSTLVDIAEVTWPRPALGLQLIGVVESRKALATRIKHIINRPIPKNARLGIIGLVAVVVIAAVVLPMARAKRHPTAASDAKAHTKYRKAMMRPVTGAQLMHDRNIFEGIMPVIKLAVEGKVGEKRPRIPMLRSELGPGILQGIIKDSADTSQHMTALFFVPVEQWPGKPLFWYLANVNESFEITGIPPGTYYLFTVETSNPRNIDDVGLPVDWPTPVQIRADGKPAHVEIEISAFLSKKARFWNLQGFLNGVGHLNADNVAGEELGPYGKLTDAQGRPVPYATVQVREFKPSRERGGGIKTPDARTNEEGYYGLRPLDYPYYVGAMAHEYVNGVAGYRWHYVRRNEVYEGNQRIDFEFGSWLPDKTVGGTIEGTVVDANGNPIPSFIVDVRPDKPWVRVDQTEEPWYKRWGFRTAFSGGKFRLTEVPPGSCNVRIMCHQSSARSSMELGEKKVTVVDAKTLNLEFSVEDWEKKRGQRVFMRLGRPGVCKAAPTKTTEPLSELTVGDTAPLFEAKTLDNKTWKMADQRGKLVLLVFWVAGSQPSEIQLPDINSAYQSFSADKQFAMLGLVRKKTKVQDLKQYVLGHDLAWEQTLIDGEDDSNLASQYGVRSWPSVILVGPDGKVIARNLKGRAIQWAVEKALTSRP